MRSKFFIGLPVAVMAMAPMYAVVAAPAQAGAQIFTCTAQTWAGEELPAVTVEAPKGKRQAVGLAKVEWRGTAKFATIDCKKN
ncbi:hypothetical protein LTV02_03260 [Nocardia yamanashiensis]|uniref:hypothetical protein n=1 Tax=Nocardia yamanashiensis TaxID=209247 RepID=UPI000AC43508|nr:hypothetical protein [Nocardia yamanashiensis]UGT42452.1 hypothetical protein LTV02_03260 [Nocardia yamanashiensis]